MPEQQDHTHEIHTPKGLITSFLILNIVSGTVGGAMQLVVPLYAMSLQASTAQIGVIRGISGLGMLLLVIPAGFLVDHFGSKKLFLTGSFSGFLSTLALVLAKVPIAMIALMGLSGLFSSLKMTALNASFFRNLKNMGFEKAGWFKGSMSIGLTFLGPAFGAFLVSVARLQDNIHPAGSADTDTNRTGILLSQRNGTSGADDGTGRCCQQTTQGIPATDRSADSLSAFVDRERLHLVLCDIQHLYRGYHDTDSAPAAIGRLASDDSRRWCIHPDGICAGPLITNCPSFSSTC